MIALPRSFVVGVGGVAAAYAVVVAAFQLQGERLTLPGLIGLVLFGAAFVLCVVIRQKIGLPVWQAALIAGVTVALPILGSAPLDPATDTYSTGGWYVTAVACLTVLLHWRGRPRLALVAIGALPVQTVVWAGPAGLDSFGVLATVLMVAVGIAGAWALRRAAVDMDAATAAERTALEYEVVQQAYHSERQVRLAATARLASPLLHRIVDAGGHLTESGRFECRVLEQTIRDEIRGRNLLNDAVRDQVIAHRRRGATVQVNDEGGLDDLPFEHAEHVRDQLAAVLRGLQSDRIVIRTAPPDSPKAVTIVATSPDPVAAALGMDDGEDTVDLWLELDRPSVSALA